MSKKKSSNQSKKAQVLGNNTPKSNYWILIVITAVALASLGTGLWVYQSSAGSPTIAQTAPHIQTAVSESQTPAAEIVVHAASDFENGQARHFSYDSPDGIKVRYFVIKSADGVIRAAFDACDVCWRSNLGYKQDGDFMVCGNCGRRFPSTQVNEVEGGCNPAPLLRQVQGDQVQIKVADILAGARFFNFNS